MASVMAVSIGWVPEKCRFKDPYALFNRPVRLPGGNLVWPDPATDFPDQSSEQVSEIGIIAGAHGDFQVGQFPVINACLFKSPSMLLQEVFE